jgi:ankyrin repeat protein
MKILLVPALLLLLSVAAVGLWRVTSRLPRAATGTALERAPASGADAKDSHGFTALDWAARDGQTDAVAELVGDGADPDLRDSGPNGWTPLLHAVHKNQPGSVRALLAAGAAVDGRGESGLTPLMLAAAQGEPEIVEELLAAGADPRLQGPYGWTALEQAVGNGNRRVVEALLRKVPGLRLSNHPRGWAVRAIAWAQGRSELLDRIERGGEARR